jgi:hypothetical protein
VTSAHEEKIVADFGFGVADHDAAIIAFEVHGEYDFVCSAVLFKAEEVEVSVDGVEEAGAFLVYLRPNEGSFLLVGIDFF